MNEELKQEISKSRLNKLIMRLYYDLNYFKIINKIGVFPVVLKAFQKHLKSQIEEYLLSEDFLNSHKTELKNTVQEYSGKGIFIENESVFAKYIFAFKLSELIVVYEIQSNEIMNTNPPYKMYKFRSLNFFNRYLQRDLKTQEAVIYTYNFSTADVDSVKSKSLKPEYKMFNKKMSMELSQGGVISFEDF